MSRHFVAFEKAILEIKDLSFCHGDQKNILIKNYSVAVSKDDIALMLSFEHSANELYQDKLLKVFKIIPHNKSTTFNSLENLESLRQWEWKSEKSEKPGDHGKRFVAASIYDFSPGYNDISVRIQEKSFRLSFYISNTGKQYQEFALFMYKILSMVFECLDDSYNRDNVHTAIDSVFGLQRYFPDVLVRLICNY